MRALARGIFLDGLKLAVLFALFAIVEEQVVEIRRELLGSSNGIAQAQGRYLRELDETRTILRNAIEDSNLQFSQARKVFEESAEMQKDERRELARLIDDRAGAIELNLRDRLEKERGKVESGDSRISGTERFTDRDILGMKRKMIFPTVQLRGEGTVGSGVLIYSEEQREGPGAGKAVTFILTAHHVVMEVLGGSSGKRAVEDVRILLGESETFDPEVFSAELVLSSRDRDTALLRLRSERRFSDVAEFAPLETVRKVDVFSRAYAVGCPLGNRPIPTAGEVSTKSKVVGNQVFWMLNAPTFFGNSGGGIYLASSCQLIGISSMIYTYGKTQPAVVPHMGLFVPAETIYEWLEAEGHAFILRREPIPSVFRSRYGLEKEPREGISLSPASGKSPGSPGRNGS